ncbi:hypothetical protein TGAM01_v206699 [Trichoderma gamsii]|uniref:Methylisocitrate lyase n=1 Tax=Trichoderma gamsii TaxID=398673 RepID=A0A2P4ZJ95_9HYPO|nr:hypothetical protein TGAM01_v206699 [Trichoderma gamsii]PON24367.1 hypothetical protein TGAM01_v206699 [Trichoderma gamsii]
MANQAEQQTAVAALRAQLADPDKIVVCPGVYDGFTARMALKAGFDCLYMTGAGTTMSRLGMPDLGIATLNDMRETASMIASLNQRVPLIADADTGYGGPVMVGRTIAQYMQAGVAALHLEDQVQSKRCGHLLNKQIVPEDEFLSRIRAAVLPVFEAVTKTLETLKESGAPPKSEFNSSGSPKALFEVVGLHECLSLDKAAGGASYNGGV